MITVTGDGFLAGVKAKFSGTGVTVNTTTRTSTATLTLDVTVSGTATVGARDMIVTNPGNVTATCTGCFTVNAKPTRHRDEPELVAGRRVARGDAHRHRLRRTAHSCRSSGTGVTVNGVTFVDSSHLALDISVAPDAATRCPVGDGHEPRRRNRHEERRVHGERAADGDVDDARPREAGPDRERGDRRVGLRGELHDAAEP